MNFIYIVCHDLGRHLQCYGRSVKTPHIDAFSRRSVRFEQAFCNTAVCSPSRAACLTGQYAHCNGMMGLSHFGWRIAPEVKTVVDYFNESGWETVHTGLSHEGEEGKSRYQVDFETGYDAQLAEAAVDDAIGWLQERAATGRTTPFYLNVGTRETHPVVWRKDEDAPGVPSRFHTAYGGPVPESEVVVPPPTPDIPLLRTDFSRFEAAIRFLDKEVGRFLREVERMGLFEDTTVVFTTDHGMNDWRGKGTMYDRGMEIALLVRPAGSEDRAGVCSEIIQNIDITPTFLDAAGLPIPEEIQGRSFWPLLNDGDYRPHDEIFLEWNFGGPQDDYSPIRAVRTSTHKLIRNFGPRNYALYSQEELTPDFTVEQMLSNRYKTYGMSFEHPHRMLPEYELYDLTVDPDELDNVADDPANAGIVSDLSARIEQWMRQTGDHLLRGEVPTVPTHAGHPF